MSTAERCATVYRLSVCPVSWHAGVPWFRIAVSPLLPDRFWIPLRGAGPGQPAPVPILSDLGSEGRHSSPPRARSAPRAGTGSPEDLSNRDPNDHLEQHGPGRAHRSQGKGRSSTLHRPGPRGPRGFLQQPGPPPASAGGHSPRPVQPTTTLPPRRKTATHPNRARPSTAGDLAGPPGDLSKGSARPLEQRTGAAPSASRGRPDPPRAYTSHGRPAWPRTARKEQLPR